MSTSASKAAEAAFRKSEKEVAVSEYDRQRKAVHEKIARLRVMRIAQESADRLDTAQAVTENAATKKPAAKRRKRVSARDVVLT